MTPSFAGLRATGLTTRVSPSPRTAGRYTTPKDRRTAKKKDAWFVTLKVKRMPLRFKIDTGADVTIITKKTRLAVKDKPRLEPIAVRLNSVGGQLKAFGQFMAVTKHRNTVYRFNVIVIEGEKITNLLSRDVAADMGLVCRLGHVEASGDDDARTDLMKTTIKLKAGAEPLCLTTARRVPFPLMDAVKAELNNMVESGVIRSVTEPCVIRSVTELGALRWFRSSRKPELCVSAST
ncbi:hypothetical protein NP493_154g00018 [Ridgeia piscesae]|uniref:Peptidase A2 domain-containing protein n=1 Tax=Ridgeia piscesae TaxID=27915 RepID=A0AAD9UFW6_RIDPI|nr:hypothetical protein NP493_154g00018 [Ridgeia piscesae]